MKIFLVFVLVGLAFSDSVVLLKGKPESKAVSATTDVAPHPALAGDMKGHVILN